MIIDLFSCKGSCYHFLMKMPYKSSIDALQWLSCMVADPHEILRHLLTTVEISELTKFDGIIGVFDKSPSLP